MYPKHNHPHMLSNVEGRGEGGVTGSRWWGERLTLVLLFMSRHVFVGK